MSAPGGGDRGADQGAVRGLPAGRAEAADEAAHRARALVEELLARMGTAARVSLREPGPAQPVAIVDITGEDLGLLIGWRGETLRAIQTVINLMLGEADGGGRRVVVDVERYRSRRERQVRDLAERVAARVARTGQRHALDPMRGYERRAVHLALRDRPDVRTESIGREPERRVVVHPAPVDERTS